jgi:beta-phosphoglucomutase
MHDFGSLKAVLWDMDGVILFSNPIHIASWQQVADRHGLPFTLQDLHQVYGRTNDVIIPYLIKTPLSNEQAAAISDEKDMLFQQLIRDKAEYLPGVAYWLSQFKEKGIRQGLASSGSIGNITAVLESLQAMPYFDVVMSGEGYPSKPAPDLFRMVAEQLGANPPECLVIEDAVAGVQAAKAAGMFCVAVTTTNPAEALSNADMVLENLGTLSREHILQLFLDGKSQLSM